MDNFDEFEPSEKNEGSESDSENITEIRCSQNKLTYVENENEIHIPKWEPWNESRSKNSKRISSRKKILVPLIIILAALIAAAAAACIIIHLSRDIRTDIATAHLSSTLMNSDNSVAKLNLNDAEQSSESVPVSSGYILTDVTHIVDEVLPSVVSITSRTLVNSYGNYGNSANGYTDIWNYYFGSFGGKNSLQESTDSEDDESDDQSSTEENEIDSGIGSGTIIAQNSSELLILTSYHVVEGSSSLYVTFVNETSVDGYIKSADQDKDIAIVAVPLADIDKDTLNSIKIATISTEEAKVGEGVIVIGNALGYGISVTTGIVSAVNREITVDGNTMTVLQTDAAINSGNSGGCMLNSSGEIIGINEAKVKVSYVEGMCYAIPVASNLSLIQNLLNEKVPFDEDSEDQSAASVNSGIYLGIRGRDVDDSIQKIYGDLPQGVYVSSTVPGSGANIAGIQSGDIIIGIDDTVISTMDELQSALSEHNVGDQVKVVIFRKIRGEYQSMTIDVTLIDRIS